MRYTAHVEIHASIRSMYHRSDGCLSLCMYTLAGMPYTFSNNNENDDDDGDDDDGDDENSSNAIFTLSLIKYKRLSTS